MRNNEENQLEEYGQNEEKQRGGVKGAEKEESQILKIQIDNSTKVGKRMRQEYRKD